MSHLSCPPLTLLRQASLFLDLDGTLFDLVDRPDQVRAEAHLVDLLNRVSTRLDGRLAIISGRSLQQIDTIFGDAVGGLALAGSHGCEHRWQGVAARPERPLALDEIAARLQPFAASVEGVLIEEKSYGVAIHFRLAPSASDTAHLIADRLAGEYGMVVQRGNMMVEVRVPGGDKGTAIKAMMRRPAMAGTLPVFAGDDLTDEAGFEAVKGLGGDGILIGAERPTAATFCLPGPGALREWLWRFVE